MVGGGGLAAKPAVDISKPLTNVKHERFCWAIVQSPRLGPAYEVAGFAGKSPRLPWQLRHKPHIDARINWLLAKRIEDDTGAQQGRDGLTRIVLPEAKIIHSRRDPVDTCLSCYTKLFAGEQAFAYDQNELGRFHRSSQGLMAHWRATLPASHFLEVDYEAVVDDLEAQARRMLDFLGLPWDERVLRFYETERPVRTASVNQVREPIYRDSKGRWRKHAAHLQPLLAALRSVSDL